MEKLREMWLTMFRSVWFTTFMTIMVGWGALSLIIKGEMDFFWFIFYALGLYCGIRCVQKAKEWQKDNKEVKKE